MRKTSTATATAIVTVRRTSVRSLRVQAWGIAPDAH